ncbi:MAG: 50S ribosomal protein L29 [Planctomycetota bacterium]
MKAEEFRGLSDQELVEEIDNLKQDLFDLRFQWQSEESPDTSRKRKIRRDIARAKTVLRKRELQQQNEAV